MPVTATAAAADRRPFRSRRAAAGCSSSSPARQRPLARIAGVALQQQRLRRREREIERELARDDRAPDSAPSTSASDQSSMTTRVDVLARAREAESRARRALVVAEPAVRADRRAPRARTGAAAARTRSDSLRRRRGRLRKNVTCTPYSRPAASATQPVTYHHSMRKSGWRRDRAESASARPARRGGYSPAGAARRSRATSERQRRGSAGASSASFARRDALTSRPSPRARRRRPSPAGRSRAPSASTARAARPRSPRAPPTAATAPCPSGTTAD